jgi:hypothetical protein
MGNRTLSEDWIKLKTWDLPTTLSSLLSILNVSSSPPYTQRQALRRLTRQPAFRACPPQLRQAITHFIGAQPKPKTPGVHQSPTADDRPPLLHMPAPTTKSLLSVFLKRLNEDG